MPKPYTLLLCGCYSHNWPSSAKFFTHELHRIFDMFKHVRLISVDYHFTDFENLQLPENTVALCHGYTCMPVMQNVPKLKQFVKHAAWFMEIVDPGLGFDHYFYYSPDCHKPGSTDRTYIPCPSKLQDLIDTTIVKMPGSLLLDHDTEMYPEELNRGGDWNHSLWEMLSIHTIGNRFSKVAQLAKTEHCPKRPDWIKVIPMQEHREYLKATAEYESFICTHIGSYNHTAVDMAARGMKVIVPFTSRGSFVPAGMAHGLEMLRTDDTMDALRLALPAKPELFYNPPKYKLDKITDLADVARIIDEHFQTVL